MDCLINFTANSKSNSRRLVTVESSVFGRGASRSAKSTRECTNVITLLLLREQIPSLRGEQVPFRGTA